MNEYINYEALDFLSDGVIIENTSNFEILFINKTAKKFLKITNELNINKIRDFFSSDLVYNDLKDHIARDLNEYDKSEGTAYLKVVDGTFLEVNFSCTWFIKEKNIICYTFKNAVEVMGESQVSFKELAEQLPSGIIVMNVENGLSITYANNEHYKILGIQNGKIEEKKYLLKDFIFEEDVHWVLSEIYMNLSKNEDVDIEFRMKTDNQIIKWVRLYGRGSISNNGEKLFYSSLKDLSQRRSVNDKLHMERVLFHKMTELTNEILFRLDLKSNIIYFLGAKNNVFGDENIYENYSETLTKLNKVHEDDVVAHNEMLYCFENGIEKPIELRYKVNEEEDKYEWYRVTYSFIKMDNGTPISAIGKMSNINTQKLLEEQAKTDLLTGFYNKVTTETEVDKLISYKNKRSFALFIIDIDNFKAINDNLGHHFGDMVLEGIADDIRSCFREDDILGRIGGDEFIIAMRDTGDTAVIIQKAELLCNTLKKSFSGGTKYNYKISASVGISMYPSDGETFYELYRKSDRALYEIKGMGKNGYKQYFNDLERNKTSYTPRINKNKDASDNRNTTILINNTIITNILNLLYESKDIEATIFLILEYIGSAFKLDKCYVFETLNNGNTYEDTYSWNKSKSEKIIITNSINHADIESLLNKADDEGVYYTNDISVIEDNWLRNALEVADVKSIFLVDSKEKYNERGVFVIEDCKSKRVWSDEEIVTLLHASRLIFNALNKHNVIRRLMFNNCEYVTDDINNTDENISININQFANTINNFYSDRGHSISSLKLVTDIVKLFKIDKITSTVYNNVALEFFDYYDCDIEGNINSYEDRLSSFYKECINTVTYTVDENIANALKLFNDKDYLHSDNIDEIKEVLQCLKFKSSNLEDISEIYVFSVNHKSVFGYIVFERYASKEREKLNKDQINIITSLCNVLNANVGKLDLEQRYEDELLMRDVILKNENMPIAIVEKDTFKILYHNDLYYNIFPNIELGSVCYELLGNSEKCQNCCIEQDILMNDANHSEHQWIKKAVPFTLNSGVEAYMVYSKDSIDYVNQINAIDSLTQALLLRGFEEYYNTVIKYSDKNYALCTLDIDKFKYINEIFDYKTGDRVLREIAFVIRNFIDADENFCRIGEDKFSIFLQYEDEVNLHTKLLNLSEQFEIMKNQHFTEAKITISSGITLIDKKLSLNTLLDQSTIARKSAKGSHKNRFSYYNPEIDNKIKKEIQLEEQVPFAIANKEFKAYLQPKFNIHTKEISGAEALVRWVTPNGMIFPDQFIPLFERNGFILNLDFIVYEQVMEHIRKCLDSNLPVYPISVNVSRNHIKDKNFLSKFMKLVTKYDIPHKYLELEITESIFVEDKQELKNFVSGIKDYTLKVSIDDFGTAYSSLQNLTDINVDILKIDKGFLDNIDMCKDTITKDEILLKNIINLAQELEFHVICEGIETDKQIELLKKVGCEYGQGYVFARPMPIEEYEKQFLIK